MDQDKNHPQTLWSLHVHIYRSMSAFRVNFSATYNTMCMRIQAHCCSSRHTIPRTLAGNSRLCRTCVCRGKMQTLIKLERRRERELQLPRSHCWCPGNDSKNLHPSWKDLEDKKSWNLIVLGTT